jgi:hypothetical protein
VSDLLAVIAGRRTRPDLRSRRLTVAARGTATVVAQFAAAMEPAIQTLYLAGGLASYQRLVDSEQYTYPFGNFVPDLLLHTDLPAMSAAMAPRRVILAGAVGATGAKLPVSEVQAEYRNAVVRPDAEWSAEAILAA